jgi:hypothetical protein
MFCKNSRTILAMAALEEEQKKAELEKKDNESPSENIVENAETVNTPSPPEPPLFGYGDVFHHEEEEESKASHLPPPMYGSFGLPWVAAHPPHSGGHHHPMYPPMHFNPQPHLPPFMMPMHPHPMMQVHNRMKEFGHPYSPPQKPNSDRASAA